MWSGFLVAHLVGLALGMGGATVKLALLLRCRSSPAFVPVFLQVARPITRQIILGMVLLTLSGLGWLATGYAVTPLLVVKLVLVAALWGVGPVIDNVAEPAFRRLAPEAGAPASAEFERAQGRYLALETAATGLFYVIVLVWLLG